MLFAACAKTENEDATSTAEATGEPTEEATVYKFALVCPLTGDSAQYGAAYRNACEILVENINAEGGINGGMIQLDVYDDKKDLKETVNIATKLAADPEILGVVGSQTSSCSMAAAPISQEAGIVMFSPSASHPDYTGLGDFIFRATLTQTIEAAAFADYAFGKAGSENVAVIYSNDE